MSKLTVIGDVPNTELSWEKLEYVVWLYPEGQRVVTQATDYLLVERFRGNRKVVANLDMGQLVALRASIDALLAGEATEVG